MGNAVKDYSIELMDAEGRNDALPPGFMAHSSQNSGTPEHFAYYLDYNQISKVNGKQVGIRVQSVPHSPLVSYSEAVFKGPKTNVTLFNRPNQTTYEDIVLRRRLNKNKFRLTKYFS